MFENGLFKNQPLLASQKLFFSQVFKRGTKLHPNKSPKKCKQLFDIGYFIYCTVRIFGYNTAYTGTSGKRMNSQVVEIELNVF